MRAAPVPAGKVPVFQVWECAGICTHPGKEREKGKREKEKCVLSQISLNK